MTKWKPLTVSLPRNQEEWEKEFEHYKLFPEYQISNKGCTLEYFKYIYFIEYFHRLVARSLGFLFAIPFSYFIIKGHIKPKLIKRCLGIFSLGLVQAGIGWWMVKSGMKEKVSTYRLLVHLNMALIIYSLLLWNGLTLINLPQEYIYNLNNFKNFQILRRRGIILLHFIAFNLISGACVAGIEAGKVYNTWPKMNYEWFPSNYLQISPKWANFFENRACVQFNHRIFGYLTFSYTLYFFMLSRKMNLPKKTRVAVLLLFSLVNMQVLDGIFTLLSLSPPILSLGHQFGGISVLTSGIYFVHTTRRPNKLFLKYLQKNI